jgi:hypothetical protein
MASGGHVASPDAVPADWLAVRRRYFTLNWVRAMFTWVAFALFLAAAYAYAGG